MFHEGRSRRRSRLDMSPLIDVVFLLLIFFAVSTTFLEQVGFELELPESSTAAPEEVTGVVLEVDSSGLIRFRGEAVDTEALEQAVAALTDEERERITVRADRRVEYGLLVRVLDALRKGGATGLSLPMVPVEPEAQSPGSAPRQPSGA